MSNVFFCHKCVIDTMWVSVTSKGRLQREKCRDCGDTYPCRSQCTHMDCAAEKREQFDTSLQP